MAEPLRRQDESVFVSERESVAPLARPSDSLERHARQAYGILRFGFTVAPIIAGADKFFNYLVNWEAYLAPVFSNTLGVSAATFMRGVGVIEIIAGIGVALKPRIFSYVVAGWLGGIIVNLLLQGDYYDIALRDLGLMLGAVALGRLSGYFDNKRAQQRSLRAV